MLPRSLVENTKFQERSRSLNHLSASMGCFPLDLLNREYTPGDARHCLFAPRGWA